MNRKLSVTLAAEHLTFDKKRERYVKRNSGVFVVIFFMALTGCSTTVKAPTLTPLQIQQIQSRSFEADKDVAFRSTVSVFQDLGYTIKSADLETGFIAAESAANSSQAAKLFGISKVDQTAVTAFIEAMGSKTSVRLNFVNRVETSSGYGQQDKQETPIYAPASYQSAFEKIENAIFIRKSMK